MKPGPKPLDSTDVQNPFCTKIPIGNAKEEVETTNIDLNEENQDELFSAQDNFFTQLERRSSKRVS